jgi:hypothetical protein
MASEKTEIGLKEALSGSQDQASVAESKSLAPTANPFTGQVFWSALSIGIFFSLIGLFFLQKGIINATHALLLLCSGLGLVFGAFGSTATINYKGAAVAGIAAITILLLVLVDYLVEDDYVQIEVSGIPEGAQVGLYGDGNYFGAEQDRRHKFFVIGKSIKHDRLELNIRYLDDEPCKQTCIFACIPKSQVEPHLGSGRILQWEFDPDLIQLKLNSPELFVLRGPCLSQASQSTKMIVAHLVL